MKKIIDKVDDVLMGEKIYYVGITIAVTGFLGQVVRSIIMAVI